MDYPYFSAKKKNPNESKKENVQSLLAKLIPTLRAWIVQMEFENEAEREFRLDWCSNEVNNEKCWWEINFTYYPTFGYASHRVFDELVRRVSQLEFQYGECDKLEEEKIRLEKLYLSHYNPESYDGYRSKKRIEKQQAFFGKWIITLSGEMPSIWGPGVTKDVGFKISYVPPPNRLSQEIKEMLLKICGEKHLYYIILSFLVPQ